MFPQGSFSYPYMGYRQPFFYPVNFRGTMLPAYQDTTRWDSVSSQAFTLTELDKRNVEAKDKMTRDWISQQKSRFEHYNAQQRQSGQSSQK